MTHADHRYRSLFAGALAAALAAGTASAGGPAALSTASYRTMLLTDAHGALDSNRYLPIGGYFAGANAGTAGDLLAVAAGRPELSSLVEAVRAAGAGALLQGRERRTLFAPTNTALAALPPERRELLFGDRELLSQVIAAHLVPEPLEAGALAGRDRVQMLDGGVLDVRAGHGMHVGQGRVLVADIAASNGVIHLVERLVALPETPKTSSFSNQRTK